MERAWSFYPRVFERADDFGIVGTLKVRGVVCIARPFIRCRLRISTEWTSHGCALLSLVIDELCCDQFVRRDAFFHPALQRLVKIVIGIAGRSELPKRVRAGAAAAVLHARSHEEPHEN